MNKCIQCAAVLGIAATVGLAPTAGAQIEPQQIQEILNELKGIRQALEGNR